MNQKENFIMEDKADNVDEVRFKISIGYLMCCTSTRPEILFSISLSSRFMHCTREFHLKYQKELKDSLKELSIMESSTSGSKTLNYLAI